MQNASTSSSHQGGSWQSPAVPNVYPNHQRGASTASNPRSYPDATERRDEPTGYDQYAYQQGQGQGQGYPMNMYYPNMSQQNYANPRRTSNPKSPPPSTAPPANPSPGSQYYRNDMQYQPSSAPPQMSTHHMSQPQTAHPYGAYYNSYFDQSQYYPNPNYAARPPGSTTTPTMPSTAVMNDHSQSPSTYQPYDRNMRPQQYYPPQQMQQGYNWQYPYGYPPAPGLAPAHGPAAIPPAAAAPPTPGKKGKKDKKEDPAAAAAAAGVLGKRSGDDKESESEDKDKKKKKGKKGSEDEKPVPKPPAKSHLHPPRQAQSAWQLFFTDELNKAKEAAQAGHSPGHPLKLNVAQIAKDAGAAYANLNDEQKAYYATKVQESKVQYAKDLAVWQATLTPEDIRLENAFRAQQRKDGKSRKGNLKDPNAPKKPLSAYFLFLKSIREDDKIRESVWGEETETTKQSVLAAERWRGLTDVEKKPYLLQAEVDKQEYETARKVYEENAAARARGEETSEVPLTSTSHVDPPASLKNPMASSTGLSGTSTSPTLNPNSTSLTNPGSSGGANINVKSSLSAGANPNTMASAGASFGGGSDDSPEEGFDQFAGFADPLSMDLTGLPSDLGGVGGDQGQWDDLHHLMGAESKKGKHEDGDEGDGDGDAKPLVGFSDD